MTSEQPSAIHLDDYTPPDYLVDTVNLDFELGESSTTVRSRLLLRRNGEHRKPLVLHGVELDLQSLALDGDVLDVGRYELSGETLRIADVADHFCVEVTTRIRPQNNTSLEGLYKSSDTFCTQCEAEGFRKITYYPDRPDVMARFSTTITADRQRYPVLLSNGNVVAHGETGSNHWVTWEDPYPKPSYLFALVAGDLACLEDRFVSASGREVTLRIYVEHHNRHKCDHAMQALKKSMKWDEQVYGLEYDLDIFMIVAVDDFNMGAMENKGLNVFNSKYVLADPGTATDDDYAAIEAVIAHEYFHNWTGNRVTCRDWFQLSLKEGLTVFRDQAFSADTFSRALTRIRNVRVLRTSQFAEDAGPMAHPVRPDSYIEINNFYTVTIYNKGAEVIRMMHTLLGADRFRQGMDLYFERHDGQAVTTDDFVQAMHDASAVDLGQFRRWYDQAGTPVLDIDESYDPDTHHYELRVRQSCPPTPGQPDKAPFHIPLAVGLLDPSGKSIELKLQDRGADVEGDTLVLDVTQTDQRFTFTDVPAPPVASLLREFSAPVKVRAEREDSALAFLSAHDPDPFNRWDAGQDFALKLMLRLIQDHTDGKALEVDPAFTDAMRNTLTDTALDPGLIGEALILPSETYVAEQMDVIDTEAVHRVREHVRTQIAEALRTELQDVYSKHASNAPYRFEPAAAGRRKLKNVCLTYLMELDDTHITERCLTQFHDADNMTDVMAAFRILTNTECDEREAVLASFLERWGENALVLDKWFTTQATCRLPNTLGQVEKLMAHPAFNLKNPNKVRSLVGAFCFGNPLHFHAADGSGYKFLADQVLRLDAMNPQVAARLMGAFARWRRFDPQRQTLMRRQLERAVASGGLSKDTFEIASKTLAS